MNEFSDINAYEEKWDKYWTAPVNYDCKESSKCTDELSQKEYCPCLEKSKLLIITNDVLFGYFLQINIQLKNNNQDERLLYDNK